MRAVRLACWLGVLGLSLLSPAASQASIPRFRVITYRPPVVVRAAAVTRDGQLWLGGLQGLWRYDGARFSAGPTVGGFEAVSRAHIVALATDPAGALWIAPAQGPLYRFDGTRLHPVAGPAGSNARNESLVIDSKGTAWLVGAGALWRYERGSWTRLAPGPDRIERLWPTAKGPPLVSNDLGWWRVAGDALVPALAADEDGSRFSPTRTVHAHHLITGRPISPSLQRASEIGRAYALSTDERGWIWLGTTRGLFVDTGAELTRLGVLEGLPDEEVRGLVPDGLGGMLAFTHGGGLARIERPVLTPVGVREGLAGNTPFAVARTRDGAVWTTTVGGLNRIEGHEISDPAPLADLPKGGLRSLFADQQGGLWITLDLPLLAHLRPAVGNGDGRVTKLPLPDIGREDPVTWIGADADGAPLVALKDGSLLRRRGGTLDAVLPATCPRRSGRHCGDGIAVGIPRRAGGLWLGTYGAGVWTWQDGRVTGRLPLEDRDTGWKNPETYGLLEDPDGTLWIGTEASLFVLAQGRLRHVPVRVRGRSEPVYEMIDDGRGNLWMAIRHGLVRATRAALLANRPARGELVAYTTADGLGSDVSMGWFTRPGVRDDDGTLWFVNVAGLTRVDPSAQREPARPRAIVEELVAGSQRFTWPALPTTVELPARERDLAFTFSAAALDAPHRLRFHHRLDGVDTDWGDAGERRSVRYVHLGPGRHTFRVRADRQDGKAPGHEATVTLNIAPFFHETRLFQALLVALALALVGLALRVRGRQVAARYDALMAERERIGQDLHDTIAQIFAALGLQVDAVETAIQRRTEDITPRLGRLRQMVAHGRHAARAVVANLRARPDARATLAEAFEGLAALYADAQVVVAVEGEPYPLGAERQNEVVWIVEQAVSNAIEHGRARRIRIELEYTLRRFVARVHDDGRGFESRDAQAAEAPGHFGLRGMRERAARAGARLTIESHPGAGTEVSIVIEQSS